MLQIMIEAESVEDLKKQALDLAASFGGGETVTVSVGKAAAAGSVNEAAPIGDGIEWPPVSEATNDNAPPAPTQKTVKMADDLGIDLADVKGTGKNGRITQADLKEYAKRTPMESADDDDGTGGEQETEEAETPSGNDPFAENEDSTPDAGADIEPTKENAKNALRVVHGEKDMDACMKVLQASGARKIGELKEDQYATFIQNCAEDIQADIAGLKEKIGALDGSGPHSPIRGKAYPVE